MNWSWSNGRATAVPFAVDARCARDIPGEGDSAYFERLRTLIDDGRSAWPFTALGRVWPQTERPGVLQPVGCAHVERSRQPGRKTERQFAVKRQHRFWACRDAGQAVGRSARGSAIPQPAVGAAAAARQSEDVPDEQSQSEEDAPARNIPFAPPAVNQPASPLP